MSAALGETGQRMKVRHSRYSNVKPQDARDALALVHGIADTFSQQVADLCAVKVSDYQWRRFLDASVPVPDRDGRSKTMAENKRIILNRLYDHDQRVAPWRGTACGVVQCVNTMTHHEGIVRNTSRADRNMLRAATGGVDQLDADTLKTLEAVLV
jgi:hypothetical protein